MEKAGPPESMTQKAERLNLVTHTKSTLKKGPVFMVEGVMLGAQVEIISVIITYACTLPTFMHNPCIV